MIGILAFIAIFIAAYFAYKTANDTGRSGPLWVLATLGIGIGIQIALPILIGIIMAAVYLMTGVPAERIAEKITGPLAIVGFISLPLSLIGIWMILRHVSKLPKDEPVIAPPPPPTFGSND